MKTCFNTLDFFSPLPTVFINSKKRYYTFTGLILSLLSIITICVFAIYFIIYYQLNSEVKIVYYETNALDKDPMNFNKTDFYFGIKDLSGKSVDPRMITFTAFKVHLNRGKLTYNPMRLENCSKKHFDKETQTDIKNLIGNKCFKTDEMNINFNKLNSTGTFLQIYISKCTNSSIHNNNNCNPQEKIDEYFKDKIFSISYGVPRVGIDHYNNKKPLTRNIENISKKLYTTFIYTYEIRFAKYEYYSDNGLVFKDVEKSEMGGKLNSDTEISPAGSNALVKNTLASVRILYATNIIPAYNRGYTKLQNIAAEIGGIIKFVLFTGEMISKYVHSNHIVVYLSNFFEDKDNSNPDNNDNNDNNVVSIYSDFMRSNPNNNSNNNMQNINNILPENNNYSINPNDKTKPKQSGLNKINSALALEIKLKKRSENINRNSNINESTPKFFNPEIKIKSKSMEKKSKSLFRSQITNLNNQQNNISQIVNTSQIHIKNNPQISINDNSLTPVQNVQSSPINNRIPKRINSQIRFNENFNKFSSISKFKELSFLESIFCKKCFNKNSIKNDLDRIEKCIQGQLSVNYFIKKFRDFENLRNVIFDEKKLKLFSYMKPNSIDQELERLDGISKKIFPEDIVIENEQDKRIMERLNHELLFEEN